MVLDNSQFLTNIIIGQRIWSDDQIDKKMTVTKQHWLYSNLNLHMFYNQQWALFIYKYGLSH